jgi:protease-4
MDNNESQNAINTIVLEYIKEQKRKRRSKWIFRAIIVLLIIVSVYNMNKISSTSMLRQKPHIGLVDIKGPIMDSSPAKADNVAKGLSKAYKDKGTKAIILRINSPGGSPVQADYVYNLVNYYKEKYPNKKVYAVCVDMCTSAAYYIASAADEIYANQSSIVGSIGVLYNGFGFVDTLQKLGIERRLITAGKNKGFLDPFSPANTTQEDELKNMLAIIHKQFEQSVLKGRGKRLQVNPETFSGLFWTGIQAKEMGLIDGFASSGEVARDIVKIKTVIDYTHKSNYFERIAKSFGASVAENFVLALGIKPGLQ